jgi:hypothetical protein
MAMSIELRPEVQAFAEAMEMKLRLNDHKGGWKKEHPKAYLFRRLGDEIRELEYAIDDQINAIQMLHREDATPKLVEIQGNKVLSEAVDVANFAMMIADVCGALEGKQ